MKGLFKRLSILTASLAMVFGVGLVNNEKKAKAEGEGKTVTYKVASTTSVTASGDAPTGSTVSFKNTYGTKDQMTSGNSQTLTLNGYQNNKITSIVLSMHSNKSKGAGTFLAKAGSTTIASINSATNFNKWYNNASYGQDYRDVNVTLTNNDYVIQSGESVVITISATQNSLYCQSFAITYEEKNQTTEPSIEIKEGGQTLEPGNKFKFTPIIENADANTKVTWSTDTTDYGTIDQDGNFTASDVEGEVTITATITVNGTDYSASVKVTVKAKIVPVIKEVSISDLLAKTAADNTVVSVKGKVSTIKDTSRGCFDLIDLSDSSKSIYVYGATKDTSKLDLTDSEEGYYTGTWSGYDSFNNACAEGDIITMNAVFLIYKGTKEIQGIITNVEKPTEAITLSDTSVIMKKGTSKTLTATLTGLTGNVTWSSSDTNVAEISEDGIITTKAAGNTTITATLGSVTATCYVGVTSNLGTVDEPFTAQDGIYAAIAGNGLASTEKYYIKGIIAAYTPKSSDVTDYGNISFDISDDGTTENVFKAYQVNYLDNQKFTSTDQVAVGDTVVLYGPVILYNGNTYETDGQGAAYVYSHTPKVTRTLESLSLSGTLTKTKYTTDDTFSPDGLTITANYSDGSTKDVTKDVSWPALTAGMTSITGTYEDKTIEVTGITVTQVGTTYTLTIKLDVDTIYENTDGTLSYELKDNKGNDFDGKITLIVWSSINENALVFIDSSTGEYLAGDAGTTTIDLLVYTDNTSVYFNASLELEVKVAPTYMVDKITADDLKATSTTYTNFENLSFTSGVSYSGNNSKDGNSYIQMRADKDKQGNYSGIISTKAKMIASKIEIEWGSKKSSNNKNKTINVYGSNVPFSSTSDLYNTSLKPIKQITYDGTSTTSTLDLLNDEKITSKYAYIGIRSSGGTLYLASVSFTWERSSNAEGFIEMWNEMRAKGTKGICNYLNGSQTPNELDELLDTYYNDETLTDADKAIINDAEDGENNTIGNSITFIEAYKASHTSNGANANNSITKVSKNNIAFILIIGFLGLTSVVGYYLIQKRRLSK